MLRKTYYHIKYHFDNVLQADANIQNAENDEQLYFNTLASIYETMFAQDISEYSIIYNRATIPRVPGMCTVIVPDAKSKIISRGLIPFNSEPIVVNVIDQDIIENGITKSNVRDYIYSTYFSARSYIEYSEKFMPISTCKRNPYFAAVRMYPAVVTLAHVVEHIDSNIEIDNTFANIISEDLGVFADEASRIVDNLIENIDDIQINHAEVMYSYVTLANKFPEGIRLFHA